MLKILNKKLVKKSIFIGRSLAEQCVGRPQKFAYNSHHVFINTDQVSKISYHHRTKTTDKKRRQWGGGGINSWSQGCEQCVVLRSLAFNSHHVYENTNQVSKISCHHRI